MPNKGEFAQANGPGIWILGRNWFNLSGSDIKLQVFALNLNAAADKYAQDRVREQEAWLCKRLLEWIKSGKPAVTGFTEGPLRQVAYAIEDDRHARLNHETF